MSKLVNIWSENSDCYHIKINKRKENMAELIRNLQRYSYGFIITIDPKKNT